MIVAFKDWVCKYGGYGSGRRPASHGLAQCAKGRGGREDDHLVPSSQNGLASPVIRDGKSGERNILERSIRHDDYAPGRPQRDLPKQQSRQGRRKSAVIQVRLANPSEILLVALLGSGLLRCNCVAQALSQLADTLRRRKLIRRDLLSIHRPHVALLVA